MEQAMRLGPTIYPILFAALLSRSLKSIGRFCAQRSVRMSTLWALMNTNATADPILHLVSMPASILVWGLLVLWVMSPLGGQSAIRLMYKTNITETTHTELRYLDNGPLGNMFVYQGITVYNDGSWPRTMRDIYLASLMQSIAIKTGPVDQWGNVKIPRLETGNASQVDLNGWMPVQEAPEVEAFTSLFGMPIVGLTELKKKGDVNFTVETTYVELSTASMHQRSNFHDQLTGMTVDCTDCYETTSQNGFLIRSQRFLGLPLLEKEGVDPNTPNYTQPRTLRFNSSIGDGTTVATSQVTQKMVEVSIECVNGSCAATKIRSSTTDRRPKDYTIFDYWGSILLELMTDANSEELAREVNWGSTSSLLFFNDSRAFPMQSGLNGAPREVNISQIDPDLLAIRASILLNTGMQAIMAPTAFAGDLPTNLSVYGPPHIPAQGLLAVTNESEYTSHNRSAWNPPAKLWQLVNDLAPFVGASSNATLTTYTEVWRPEYTWVVILIVSTVILVAVGVAGVCVRMKTMAPNMFDPVAGLTYNNPYLSLTGREYDPLDADERANLLGEKRVQIGEVDDYKGVKAVFGEAGYVTPLRLGIPYH
ncbi:uncharacterized protein DSM5745_00385 [Aspergillus mulundensis]|uniref:Transmembrane protein n=1 Tax=Aspergillus mulundensis TaxID=1810919 RepID=A0A3D8T3D4_9EURO|nr:Uncharacterized protein DSM5745_00385 [Aspergillus mulundensis]RDW93063.1 Uncharacterized protein DSM5745_00385 [Aspergillus mulundensis]